MEYTAHPPHSNQSLERLKLQIHLLGLQHSEAFIGEELAGCPEQLSRYAEALRSMERRPVCAWLVALRSGKWTPFPVDCST